MKNWFPFSDYDFFGYLSSGFVLLFSIDYIFNEGVLLFKEHWTFMEIALAVVIIYFLGQLIAHFSSLILEYLLVRKILKSPVQIMLTKHSPKWIYRIIGNLVGRYYEPLPSEQRKKIIAQATKDNNTEIENVEMNTELVFLPAYQFARQNPDVRQRMYDFRNQYGLHRNMAFTFLVVAGLFIWSGVTTESVEKIGWIVVSFLFFLVLMLRFLKFYAAFSSELLRNYLSKEK